MALIGLIALIAADDIPNSLLSSECPSPCCARVCMRHVSVFIFWVPCASLHPIDTYILLILSFLTYIFFPIYIYIYILVVSALFLFLFLFLYSRWSFLDVPLMFSCPADHVYYWVWYAWGPIGLCEKYTHAHTHLIQPEFGENEQADAGRDGRTRLTRPNSQVARTGTGKYSFFPVHQQTTSSIGNLTRLVHPYSSIFVSHLRPMGLNGLGYQSQPLQRWHLACGHKGSILPSISPSGSRLMKSHRGMWWPHTHCTFCTSITHIVRTTFNMLWLLT